MIETELCTFTLEACQIAADMGITRVELCASPYEGGTTPSAAFIRMARLIPHLKLSVMIRPRGGDFLYSDEEFHQMLEEISFAHDCGADCVVAGILTPDGRVDEPRTAALVAAAQGMEFTFHRAFDMTRDTLEALEALVRAGCYRVLTSGGRNTAPEGIENIQSLVEASAGRIAIMAGSGINASNVKRLAGTGINAIHFSARNLIESHMTYKNPSISMGGVQGIPEYASIGVDSAMIRNLISQLT